MMNKFLERTVRTLSDRMKTLEKHRAELRQGKVTDDSLDDGFIGVTIGDDEVECKSLDHVNASNGDTVWVLRQQTNYLLIGVQDNG